MKIKHLLYLLLSVLPIIFVSCNGRGTKGPIDIDNPKPPIKLEPFSANIYVENSGSMAGYCNIKDMLAIETLVDDYYERLNSSPDINDVSLNFINTAIEKSSQDKKEFLKSIKGKCIAKYTKLDDMLEMMMDSVNDNCVNLLISDYVFTTNSGNLAIAASGITSQFTKQLERKDFAVAIFKYMVNFQGLYYPGGLKCNKPLPIYVWVFGKKENVRKITRLPFSFKNCGTYFMQKTCEAEYELDVKDHRMINGKNIKVSEWGKRRNKDYYEFALKTKLDHIILNEKDIINTSKYVVSTNTSTQYIIQAIDNEGEDKYKFTIMTKDSKPSPGMLKIAYPIEVPQWVEASNYVGNGIPADSTTYGVSYLINGVGKAFENISKNNNNYFTINIKLE